jgi:hypothetical protein
MAADEFISLAGARKRVGAALFPSDHQTPWMGRLKMRERELIDWYGPGPGPEPGTRYFSEYDPFAAVNEGEDHAETERARHRYWTIQWQIDQVDAWLNGHGFSGRKFLCAQFEKAFAFAFGNPPPQFELRSELAQLPATEHPESIRKDRGGAPRKFDRDLFFIEIVRIANTPDGLPDRRDLARHMADWCAKNFEEPPAENTIRAWLAKVCDRLDLR